MRDWEWTFDNGCSPGIPDSSYVLQCPFDALRLTFDSRFDASDSSFLLVRSRGEALYDRDGGAGRCAGEWECSERGLGGEIRFVAVVFVVAVPFVTCQIVLRMMRVTLSELRDAGNSIGGRARSRNRELILPKTNLKVLQASLNNSTAYYG